MPTFFTSNPGSFKSNTPVARLHLCVEDVVLEVRPEAIVVPYLGEGSQ